MHARNELNLNKLHNMSAHMFFMMGVLGIFAPPLFPHVDRARACAQPAPAHRRARQRAHRLNFFMVLKLMLFFNMFDIFNFDSTVANIGRRYRIGDTQCARACVALRQSCLRACAGIPFQLAPAQPPRLIGHLLHSEPARHARLDRVPRARAPLTGRPLRAPPLLRGHAALRAPLLTRGSGR